MPLNVRPPRGTRFGSPLVLSRVHWVRPEMVVEVTYLTWTDDNLLRHVVFDGVREDKPARGVVRPISHPEKVEARKNKSVPRGKKLIGGLSYQPSSLSCWLSVGLCAGLRRSWH